jgi:hypothetical protein
LELEEYSALGAKELQSIRMDFEERILELHNTSEKVTQMLTYVIEHHASRDKEISNHWDKIIEAATSRKAKMLADSRTILNDKGMMSSNI